MAKHKRKRYYRKKLRKSTSIYVISAGEYFYVGKSNNPYRRLEAHKDKALNDIGQNKRKNRIFRKHLRSLRLQVIERPKMKDWRKREIAQIAKYRKRYGRNRVLNATDGGDGASGGGHKDKQPFDGLGTFLLAIPCVFFACLILSKFS